jgi:toluene monooxygenase system protein D
MADNTGNNNVGPVLSAGEIADAAIEAVYQDNPDPDIIVENHVAYIRVETDTECVIRRETMEACLGRPFQMHELETVLSSFAGQIETSTEHMRFYLVKKL